MSDISRHDQVDAKPGQDQVPKSESRSLFPADWDERLAKARAQREKVLAAKALADPKPKERQQDLVIGDPVPRTQRAIPAENDVQKSWDERLAVARAKREKVLAAKALEDPHPKVRRPAFMKQPGLAVGENVWSAAKPILRADVAPTDADDVANLETTDRIVAGTALVPMFDERESARTSALAVAPPAKEQKPKRKLVGLAVIAFVCSFGLGLGIIIGMGFLFGANKVVLASVDGPPTAAVAPIQPLIQERAPSIFADVISGLKVPVQLTQSEARSFGERQARNGATDTAVLTTDIAQPATDPGQISRLANQPNIPQVAVNSLPEILPIAGFLSQIYWPDISLGAFSQPRVEDTPRIAAVSLALGPKRMSAPNSVDLPKAAGDSLPKILPAGGLVSQAYWPDISLSAFSQPRIEDTPRLAAVSLARGPKRMSTPNSVALPQGAVDSLPDILPARGFIVQTYWPVRSLSAFSQPSADDLTHLVEVSLATGPKPMSAPNAVKLPQVARMFQNDETIVTPVALSAQVQVWPTQVDVSSTVTRLKLPATDLPLARPQPTRFLNARRNTDALPLINPGPIKEILLAEKLGYHGQDAKKIALFTYAPDSVTEAQLDQNQAILSQTGFPVENVNKVGFTVSKTHIRFYNSADAALAQAIAAEIGVTAKDFSAGKGTEFAGRVEIWLSGRGNAPAAAPKRKQKPKVARVPSVDQVKKQLVGRLVEILQRGDHR